MKGVLKMDLEQKKMLRTCLLVVGGILVLIFFIKLGFGMYVSELPLYLIPAVAGFICIFIAQKLKIVKPGEDKAGLMLADKWKCSCGAYNDKNEVFCGNCGAKKPELPAQ
jgi:hypothetical protein